jgi:protoporphyrinogen oxidase
MGAHLISSSTSVVVLGAGLAGLAAAWRLSESYDAQVLLIEKNPYVGGLAATIENMGRRFDLGSHRVHHSLEPTMISLLRELCEEDLQQHMREGLMLIDENFVRYPPTPFDLFKVLGTGRCLNFTTGMIAARIKRSLFEQEGNSFESYILSTLGKPLYFAFYKPYAEKLYGVSPDSISDEAGRKRIRRVFLTEIKRLFSKRHDWLYFYPSQGIGSIAESMKKRFLENGGKLLLGSAPTKLELDNTRRVAAVTYKTADGRSETVKTEALVSTIPPDILRNLLSVDSRESPPCSLTWRGLRIVFLITRDWIDRRPETYYIPSPDYLIGRVSEIAKYSTALEIQDGCRAFTLEIPCTRGDDVWNMAEEALRECCCRELAQFGIIKPELSETPQMFVHNLERVYPLYSIGWQKNYADLCAHFNSFPNIYRIGRTALFLHCNLDHSIAMGLRFAEWFSQSDRTFEGWREIEKGFGNYYVRE